MAAIKQNLDEKYWMFGYDLPAESRSQDSLTDEQRTFLNSMRKTVWTELRHTFKCVPVQMSLWNIREPDKTVKYNGKMMTALEGVKTAIGDWRAKYADQGFKDVNMEMFPIATDHVGLNYIKNSQMTFVFSNLQNCERMVDEGIKKGKFKTRRFNEIEMRREDMRNMFVEDFSSRHQRWTEFEQIYMRLKRKMEDKLRGMLV